MAAAGRFFPDLDGDCTRSFLSDTLPGGEIDLDDPNAHEGLAGLLPSLQPAWWRGDVLMHCTVNHTGNMTLVPRFEFLNGA